MWRYYAYVSSNISSSTPLDNYAQRFLLGDLHYSSSWEFNLIPYHSKFIPTFHEGQIQFCEKNSSYGTLLNELNVGYILGYNIYIKMLHVMNS
jgi:hypothetical protein